MKKIIVSKDDLRNNLNIINSMKLSKCQLIGVVKANGMGLDLLKYSRFLIENGVKFLAVSDVDDAIYLRDNNIRIRILLLTPVNDEEVLSELIIKNIILTVSTVKQAEKISKLSRKLDKKASIHVKIDTGFGRYGFLHNKYKDILTVYNNQKHYIVKGIYTHFSNAIDEKYTKTQFERFEKVLDKIESKGFKPGVRHCCNSTAFIKYKKMHLDAVRLGSIIQGRTLVSVDGLKQIGKFETSIAEIKTLPKGYNIGYGNTYKTKKSMKVAIIPVGHSDGFETRNKRDNFGFIENLKSVAIEIRKIFKPEYATCLIEHKRYRIIGRIGLNYSVVDISKARDVNIQDKVEVKINPLNANCRIRREYI